MISKYGKIESEISQCGPLEGVWIDAGCGNGTYTIPLANLVEKVIAIDSNKNNLLYLKSLLSSENNILTLHYDFTEPKWYDENVDGILFGFSLHETSKHILVLKHAYNQLKADGKLIIIDYSSDTAVSWVPYPIPESKLTRLLGEVSFQKVSLIKQNPPRRKGHHWNNASYIITAMK
ncbi:MAG: class I SAM-dependent methyltransferase [Candidatus Hodarchaeales archaeon]